MHRTGRVNILSSKLLTSHSTLKAVNYLSISKSSVMSYIFANPLTANVPII